MCRHVGVNYNLDNSLPQGVMYLDGVSAIIENSLFSNLVEYGQGSIILQDSNIAFENVTFVGNTQAAAGAIFANTSTVSVTNSNFTNNYGFQSGAIQLLGNDSSLYINGTIFHNNTGMHSDTKVHSPDATPTAAAKSNCKHCCCLIVCSSDTHKFACIASMIKYLSAAAVEAVLHMSTRA